VRGRPTLQRVARALNLKPPRGIKPPAEDLQSVRIMAIPMRFLYGDSTESPIEIDYLSFVRGGVDFAVEVLAISEHLAELLERRQHVEEISQREVAGLEALGETLRAAVAAEASQASAKSISACAEAMTDAGARVIAGFVQSAQSKLRDELARIDGELSRKRQTAGASLDKLLLAHPIPGTRSRLQLTLLAGTERYEARLSQSSDLGLIWTTDLEIPADHLASSVLRVDRVLERLGLPKLVVRTPGEGGVFRKKVKWVPQRLGKEYVVGFSRGEQGTSIQLREGMDLDQPGFDIVVQGAKPRVLVKVLGRGDASAETFEPEPDDAAQLLDFARALAHSLAPLRGCQAAILDSRFDGKRFSSYETPADLVRRLLGSMAPVVREIARRSPGEQELVLKRLVGDDRREEAFVSFEELRTKIEHLPEHQQREFAIFPFYPAAEDDEVTVDRSDALPVLAPRALASSSKAKA
jgi:hypothetical protein